MYLLFAVTCYNIKVITNMLAIELALFVYFSLAVLYTLLPSVAGNFRKKVIPPSRHAHFNKIAVFVPAYKEDAIIYPIAQKLLQQNYPKEAYDIVVIADSLQAATLKKLSGLPVVVIEVKFEKSTKTKSLVYALEKLDGQYDIAMISDADNILEADFLSQLNQAYNAGYMAIQGKRVAKNLNTTFAVLDAISEIINNHIFRKGFNALGLSSSLIGSGMAFRYEDLKNCLKNINAVGGFDRVLQLYIIEKGHKILYLESALIYDEKIENSQAFTSQRRRWIASQFIYLARYFKKGMKSLFQGNFDYFNASVLYNLFLPRTLTLGFLFIISLVTLIVNKVFFIPFYWWAFLFLLNSFALIIAVPRKFYDKKFLTAIMNVPRVFLIMFSLLFKLKGADKKFIHTKHTKVDIDENIISQKTL